MNSVINVKVNKAYKWLTFLVTIYHKGKSGDMPISACEMARLFIPEE